jgi:hypothetical protein
MCNFGLWGLALWCLEAVAKFWGLVEEHLQDEHEAGGGSRMMSAV